MSTELTHLKSIRVACGIGRKHVEAITAAAGRIIPTQRQDELENGPKRAEPWYDEAVDLSRILLLPGIMPMITPAHISSCTILFGQPLATDIDFLRAGIRLPLSMACRITVELGLDDPIELEQHPRFQQIWSTIERNERSAGVDECPWCLGYAGLHLPTCLPENLWASREVAPYLTANMPRPQPASKRTRGTARKAGGLKALRVAKGITQIKLANDIDMNANYYSRIERGDLALTTKNAEKIAQLLGCPVDALY